MGPRHDRMPDIPPDGVRTGCTTERITACDMMRSAVWVCHCVCDCATDMR